MLVNNGKVKEEYARTGVLFFSRNNIKYKKYVSSITVHRRLFTQLFGQS
ncbi:hypothetical protein QY96_00590 [Bacillus thermotolerans]|uniref:Uncharacterized protein n=1 Tax=Bacillus thermotolerans TaxID=1221996 RepID=A0A0F5I4S0_BACTR|nr:hypothetical protein QY95_01218 [Bacillus thermotolerans]KKB43821.1 hypothetical protein QY96_00590 [Bacillus thermotolerans]